MAASPLGSRLAAATSYSIPSEAKKTETSTGEKGFPTPVGTSETQKREAKQMSPDRLSDLKGNIKRIADKIDQVGIQTLGGHLKNIPLAHQMIETLKNVDAFTSGKIAAFNENFVKISIGGDQHVYVHHDAASDSLHVIFDKNNRFQIDSGAYKKLFQGFQLQQGTGVERLIFSKEKESLEKIGGDFRNSNLFREQTALKICREKGIPGTPKTYFVTTYQQKEGLGQKQAILAKFYPGGDLIDQHQSLPNDERIRIGKDITRTIASLHENGVNYNDLKMDNIVINEDGNPILIDYGGAILDVDFEKIENPRIVSTPQIHAPELFVPERREEMANLIRELHQMIGKSEVLAGKYQQTQARFDEMDAKSDDMSFPPESRADFLVEARRLLTELDTMGGEYEKIEERVQELKNQFNGSFAKTMDLSGYQRKKNDDYALGLLLLRLHGGEPEGAVKEIVDGLLALDPSKRLTAQMALEKYKALG